MKAGNQINGGELIAPLLELRGITKVFAGLRANDSVDFDVRRGEIHALLGENGAGKTTLMNVLYGLYHPDEGEILLQDEPLKINSPRDAINHRIGMIHQHFMLVPNFTVAENIVLGLPVNREPLLDLKTVSRQVLELSKAYGLDINPNAITGELPVGVQQRVEILKALYRGSDLLILDEPTAVLSPLEVEEFFKILKRLVKQDLSIIFISHKLDEVLAISNRITVLRRGKKIGTVVNKGITKEILAEMMVGREVFLHFERSKLNKGEKILQLQNVVLENAGQNRALDRVSLAIQAGEVLGIAGVEGNGQQELAEVVSGLRRVDGGQILIKGVDFTNRSPQEFINGGVCLVPADRQNVGLVLNFSVEENLILKNCEKPPFERRGVLDWSEIHEHGERLVSKYDIRVSDAKTAVRKLSGGNQQKVILAREIENRPSLLVLVHPTRGLDIGATEYVRQRIMEQREKGVAILLISTELDEIFTLSDKVAVIFRGEIMGVVPGDPGQLEKVSHMMLGERLEIVQ